MCGPHSCRMKMRENIRKFAAEQNISEQQSLQPVMEQKAREFVEKGAEPYIP